jgi:U3 small nucleolar RNA-associated protein 11
LEKKKDYKQRAKNYHDKEKRLNDLRLKASLKNEDEFYFRMLKGKNKDGEHIELDSDESDLDEREYRTQLKSSNQTIVTMQRSIEANVRRKSYSETLAVEV